MTLVHTDYEIRYQTSFWLRITRRFHLLARELPVRFAIKKDLSGLSDQALRDIGLTRNDVERIVQRPLSKNVATELKIRSLRQSRNW